MIKQDHCDCHQRIIGHSYVLWFVIFIFYNENVVAQAVEEYLAKAQEYHAQSLPDSAVYFYKKAILSYHDTGGKIEGLNAAVDIADLFYSNNDFDKGLEILYVLPSETLTYKNEDERVALLEMNLFKAYGFEKSGRYGKAKEVYEETRLELVNKIEYEDFYVARYLYQPLGNIYTRLGEIEEALKLLERFKEISIDEREYEAAAQAYNDIGIIYKSLNHYERVIGDYQAALDFPGLSPKTKGLLLSNLATAYYETLQNDNALETAQKALTEFQNSMLGNEHQLDVLSYLSLVHSTIGKIHTSLGDGETAIRNFNQSIELAIQAHGTSKRREIAKIYVSIGYLFLLQNDALQALAQFQKALSCVIPGFETEDINQNPNVQGLYPENAIFEALDGKTRAFELLYRSKKDASLLKRSLECFDLISHVESQLRQSHLNESSKLLLIEESHRRSERALQAAYELYRLTNDQEYIEKAFQIAERNKATILLESVRTLKVNDFGTIPDSLLRGESELRSRIALLKKNIFDEQLNGIEMDTGRVQSLSDELFAVESGLQRVNAIFQNEYPQYYQLRNTTPVPVDVARIRHEIIDTKTQLIEYFLGEDELFILSITQDELKVINVPAGSLKEAVQQLLTIITANKLYDSDPVEFAGLSLDLYNQLLAPVIRDDKQRLIIIPDGMLGYLPFDLLVKHEIEDPKFNTLPYLLRSKTVSFGFSAAVLLENADPLKIKNKQKPFLGMAPIFVHSSNFQFLPFSEREVRYIQEEMGGQILLGEKATKSAFKVMADQFQVIHLSSHASVIDSLPLYSWIGFNDKSGKKEDDFKLYLSELYSMRFNADLAVLSACETGTGNLSNGEGIMSLARGFTYAGCHSIVTTLWPVNDASTSFIMTRFYQHLSEGVPKDESLRLAKLDYLNDDNVDRFGAHPFFWAAYIPIGNMEPVELENDGQVKIWIVLAVLAILSFLVLIWKNYKRIYK